MSDLTDLTENSVGRPSRRQVLVGTAWAVPVVMGVGATPAMAASTISSAAAITDDKKKFVTFTITVTGWHSGDVLTPGTVAPEFEWHTAPANSYTTPSSTVGTTATFKFTATGKKALKGNSYTLPFTVSKTGGGTLSGSVSFTY